VIRKEAWSFYGTISGVRLCWELEEPKGPKVLWTQAVIAPHKGLQRDSVTLQGYLVHTNPPPPRTLP